MVVKILPHSKAKIFETESFNKDRSKKEIPNIKENKMPMEILFLVFDFFEMGSISIDENMHNTKAHITGFIPNSKPINAPAKAACAIVIPMKVIFNNNIQTPIIPQDIPQNTDIIIALLKN